MLSDAEFSKGRRIKKLNGFNFISIILMVSDRLLSLLRNVESDRGNTEDSVLIMLASDDVSRSFLDASTEIFVWLHLGVVRHASETHGSVPFVRISPRLSICEILRHRRVSLP